MSFATTLKNCLECIVPLTTFQVYDIKSKFTECSTPLYKQHKGSTSSRHRLILVSTAASGFVCGLETYEYKLTDVDSVIKNIVYVSKVDTNSMHRKYKGLTARLIQAYITSLPCNTSVFVFARAQPQYLFAKSADNEDKKILSDRELVSWWLHVLNKVKRKCEGVWFIPGIEDSSSALIEIGARKRGWAPSTSIKWQYSVPFDSEADAASSIPQFEDDAKSRLLKNIEGEQEKMSVKDFFNILSIGEECGSGKLTGFFKLKLNVQENETSDFEDNENDTDSDSFTVFWNRFMSLNFENENATKVSSKTAKRDINEILPKLKPIVVNTKAPVESTSASIAKKTTDENTNKRPAVNVLSTGLIKRKKH
ncbi:H3 K56 histone acetylation protein RTT109 [Mycotypha africana]|uniref:H3 K56 histone acetylation protein RTT109 n=1 Tax=Mycotypha africana TaxID=64632 RepID=UPI0022FFCA30|nr:H3 K56 histone acetylation protein RTT109 [Mycotypha africana]KAI8987253.1 H3 K56 histone acetylation protein RTT109 [Mycotypha africana]